MCKVCKYGILWSLERRYQPWLHLLDLYIQCIYSLQTNISKKYQQQASDLGLINFTQMNHTGDDTVIHSFLNSLDVYTHGRSDGETFGLVLTEAMFHGLPLISHEAQNNAQYEVIGNAGKVFGQQDIVGYSTEMFRLKNNKHYYNKLSKNSLDRFSKYYSYESNFKNLLDLINRGILSSV